MQRDVKRQIKTQKRQRHRWKIHFDLDLMQQIYLRQAHFCTQNQERIAFSCHHHRKKTYYERQQITTDARSIQRFGNKVSIVVKEKCDWNASKMLM